MDGDGSGLTNLTNNPAGDGQPVWSPDGSKILFVSDRDGNDEIYVMKADGSDPTNLTDNRHRMIPQTGRRMEKRSSSCLTATVITKSM